MNLRGMHNFSLMIILLCEVKAIKNEVESVKQDVTVLHNDVDEQSAKVSEDLEHVQNYKNGISKVKPGC